MKTKNALPVVVKFQAALADTETAISLPGQSDGLKIKLEVPETQIANALGIVRFRGKLLEIEIREA